MKKYFKLAGIALLAAGMFTFTSCEDDNEEVENANAGVTVTFGSTTWEAQYSEGATYVETEGRNKRFFALYGTPNTSIGYVDIQNPETEEVVDQAYVTFPMLYLFTEAAKGNNHGSDVNVQYYEKEENTYAFEDDGEWDLYGWENDDDMIIAVSAFDASTLVISGTAKGNMHEINATGNRTGEIKALNAIFKEIALEDLDAEE